MKYLIFRWLAIFLACSVAFGAGFMVGVDVTINKMVNVIPHFANITIDPQVVNDALFRYNQQLNSCWVS